MDELGRELDYGLYPLAYSTYRESFVVFGVSSPLMRQPPFDLFGEVPVTQPDVELWLDSLPRMKDASASRRTTYTRQWNVVEKIQAAKINGQWPPVPVWQILF